MSAQRPFVKGSLGFLDARNPDQDLVFQFNPTTISRSRRATYAHSMAALADFPNAGANAIPSIEWNRNEAEDISFDLMLHRRAKEGGKPANVEADLKRIDDFMKPDANTGRPRDLVLKMGPRSDRVRITDKNVVERLFDPDLNVQQATVSLKMIALRSRSK